MAGIQKTILGLTAAVIACLIIAGTASGAESEVDVLSRLPLEYYFHPGTGQPVGQIVEAGGGAFIIHGSGNVRYPAIPNRPLYKGDTLLTTYDGNMVFELNDGSRMTVAANTAISVTHAEYDPEAGIRSSFLNMMIGRVRFMVKDMKSYKQARFHVTTKTSVAGVRGSDFIIIQTLTQTEIITLRNTILEVIGHPEPADTSTMMSSFQRLVVQTSGLIGQAEELSAREALEILREVFDEDEIIEAALDYIESIISEIPAPPARDDQPASPVRP